MAGGLRPQCPLSCSRPYQGNPTFDPEFIRSKSTAAAGLCSWCINIVRFYEVYCDVAPKRRALEEANAELAEAQEKLSRIKSKIAVSAVGRRGWSVSPFERGRHSRCHELRSRARARRPLWGPDHPGGCRRRPCSRPSREESWGPPALPDFRACLVPSGTQRQPEQPDVGI